MKDIFLKPESLVIYDFCGYGVTMTKNIYLVQVYPVNTLQSVIYLN